MTKTSPISFLTLLVLLLFCVYVAETNSLSTQGYEISKLQQELQDIKQFQTQLNTEIARESSIIHLQSVPEIATMQASKFQYLQADGALVQR